METIITSIIIVATSTFKYLFGILLAVGSENVGLWESYIYNVGGGLIGIILFTHFGAMVQSAIKEKFQINRAVFSWKTRLLVGLRRSFGLPGIAFITPVILSIPIGIGVALSLTKDKKSIIWMMVVSCIFWSSVLFLPYYLFDVNLHEIIRGWFH